MITKRKLKDLSLLFTLSPKERKLILSIIEQKLTYLSIGRLKKIARTCEDIKKKRISGIFIEAGCALGGSSILISKLKPQASALHVYDAFDMIPPPSESDGKEEHERYKKILKGDSDGIRGDKYYGYEDNLLDKVVYHFEKNGVYLEKENVQLHKGLLQDTMCLNTPVIFAHIDVDWYDSVYASLKRIFPKLLPGGSIILDDYFDWDSCKKATDYFLKSVSGHYKLDKKYWSLKITKLY
ncbi:MAG: TylF/MycF/NovP-related O-methyltransferase [Bacteroidota bacterium]